jgi:hypothetical protein
VGILRSLRHKGVATLDDDDASAIEKAIQPFVTGAGRRGNPRAPNNAGLGLHTTRSFARDCGGEMVILSGAGCFWQEGTRPHRLLALAPPARWQGTVVSVTLRPGQIGAFALGSAQLGLSAGSSDLWRLEPPPGALLLSPPVDSARFAADKEWYREHRPEVMEALAAGRAVHVDFGKAVYTTQSAIHALLAEPVRTHGVRALELLTFGRGGHPLREAVTLVLNYSFADRDSVAETSE